jgi:hypothetical protein
VGLSIDSQLDLVNYFSKYELGIGQKFGPGNSRQIAIDSAKVDPQPVLNTVNELKQRQAEFLDKAKSNRIDILTQRESTSFVKRSSLNRDDIPSFVELQRRNPPVRSEKPEKDFSNEFVQRRVQKRQDNDNDIDTDYKQRNDYDKAQRAYSAYTPDTQTQVTFQVNV